MSKKLILLTVVAVFFICWTNESHTEEINCKTGQQSCGTNCCWSVEGTTLKITSRANGNIGTMDNYSYTNFYSRGYAYLTTAPWKDLEISSVDVQGVKNLGAFAFIGMALSNASIGNTVTTIGADALHSNALTEFNLPDSIKTIDFGAFAGALSVKPDVIKLPDSLTTIGAQALRFESTIIMPDTVTKIGTAAINPNAEIVCKGTKTSCQNLKNLLSKYCPIYSGCSEDKYVDLSKNFSVASFSECSSTNYYWNGAECVREPDVTKRKCCDSCKDMGGYCNRVRYTPAEAAAVMNGNDNTITNV